MEEPSDQLRRRVLRWPEIEALVADIAGGAIVVPEFVAGATPNRVGVIISMRGVGGVVNLDDIVAGGHGVVAVGFLVVENRELLVVGIWVSGAGKPFEGMFVMGTIRFEGLPDRLHQSRRNKCYDYNLKIIYNN